MVGWRAGEHVWPLVALHVRGERGGRVIAAIADGALEWFPVVMGFEVDFKVVAAREGAGAVLALVTLVASVQLDMPVATSFVLEGPITIIAGVDGVGAGAVIGAIVRVKGLVHQGGRAGAY